MEKVNPALAEIIESIPRKQLSGKINRAAYWKHRKGLRIPGVKFAKVYCLALGLTLEEFYQKIKAE